MPIRSFTAARMRCLDPTLAFNRGNCTPALRASRERKTVSLSL
jgi:hypothetical protein